MTRIPGQKILIFDFADESQTLDLWYLVEFNKHLLNKRSKQVEDNFVFFQYRLQYQILEWEIQLEKERLVQ